MPKNYEAKLRLYEDTYFVEKLREKAIYFKVKPKDSKSQTAVGVFSATDFLSSIGNSYLSLMKFSVMRDFKDKIGNDFKRLQKIIKALNEDLEPKIVATQYSSFAVAIGSNIHTAPPDSLIDIDWKQKLFNDFKEDVVELDYDNQQKVNSLLEKYDENTRIAIYKPLIDLYNSKKIAIAITDHQFKEVKPLKAVKTKYSELILKKTSKPPSETYIRLAQVEFSLNSKTSKHKLLDIFEQTIQAPVFATEKIIWDGREYKLKNKLFAEYSRDSENHLLENNDLGIFVHGESLLEAEQLFYEEFDFIYQRYNSLKEEELTADVLFIRNYLNKLVVK